MRIFSYKNRPVHLGPYPLECLTRQRELPPMGGVPETQALNYDLADPHSIAHAMKRYVAMFDVMRDGCRRRHSTTSGPRSSSPAASSRI